MINKVSKNVTRQKRHLRIRQNIVGTAAKPRLNVFRSNKQIYAQIIDDTTGKTLCSASSLDKDLKLANGGNAEAAAKVGTLVAKRALALKIEAVVFDRGGYVFHVSDSLEKLKCTRIVIAHRLSTIKQCDRIVVLDKGHIIEDGTYDELIAKKGFFAELVERQRVDI